MIPFNWGLGGALWGHPAEIWGTRTPYMVPGGVPSGGLGSRLGGLGGAWVPPPYIVDTPTAPPKGALS